jgi:hypothetical protein
LLTIADLVGGGELAAAAAEAEALDLIRAQTSGPAAVALAAIE